MVVHEDSVEEWHWEYETLTRCERAGNVERVFTDTKWCVVMGWDNYDVEKLQEHIG